MSEPILIQLREEDGEVTEECLGTLYVEYAGKPKVMVQMAIEPLQGEDDFWEYFEWDDPECPAFPRMFSLSDGCYSFAAIGRDETEERCFDEDSSPVALARFAQIYAAALRIAERAKKEQPVFFGYRDLERLRDYMSPLFDQHLATEPPRDPRPPEGPGKRRKKS